jgi:long-chain acyl-CoA synthetase
MKYVDGYFHTGYMVFFDKDGFLKITDRKKEMFKTSGGNILHHNLLKTRWNNLVS